MGGRRTIGAIVTGVNVRSAGGEALGLQLTARLLHRLVAHAPVRVRHRGDVTARTGLSNGFAQLQIHLLENPAHLFLQVRLGTGL